MSSFSSVKAAPGDCDTIIKVDYSNLNFKDAMVATGSYPGLQFPMVGGIDLVGRVMSTTNPHLKKGDEVLINGFGMGTDHWGGFAEKASVPGHWCVVSVGHPSLTTTTTNRLFAVA